MSFGRFPFRKELRNHNEMISAIIIPTRGAIIIKLAVLRILGSEAMLIAPKPPACAIAAPAKPPMSVCDEEEGIPNHHVSRFQQIAAINPENTTGNVINSFVTVLAIVLATP